MLKITLASVILILLTLEGRSQVTIAANAVSTTSLLDASGTALLMGDAVRVGYFPAADLSTIETSTSYSAVNSDFTPIGEGTTGGGSLVEPSGNGTSMMDISDISGPGTFYATFNNVSSPTITTGQDLFLWVFNSSNPSTATQWGIFYDPTDWQYPSNNGGTTLSLGSSPSQDIDIARGSKSGSNYELANVSAVPEPSALAAMASAVAIGAMVLRRRR